MTERGKCQVCSKICEARCGMCRGVYYCCKEHQKEDWLNHKENCSKKKYKVDKNDKLGRFLVVTEDVKADNILFKDKPLVIGPKAGLLDVEEDKLCLGCYKLLSTTDEADSNNDDDDDDSSTSSTCSKCGLPVCSSECASQYFHKQFECKLFNQAIRSSRKQQQQQQGNEIKNSVRTPPQENNSSKEDDQSTSSLVPEESSATSSGNESKQQQQQQVQEDYSEEIKDSFMQHLLYFRCLLLKHVNEKHWEELMSLQSNNEFRENVSNLEKTARVFEEMKATLGQIGHPVIDTILKPDLHKILGILDTNAVDIKISPSVELTGLYPIFSMVEYSCFPSAKYYFIPPTLKMTTTTTTGGGTERGKSSSKQTYELYCRSAVKLHPGDHISIAVTNLLWNTQKRREELKKTKYFWCECPRCIDPYELGSNFSSILCPISDCKAISVPVPKPNSSPTDHEFQWQCVSKKCGKTCELWQVKKVDSKLSETIGKLSSKATVKNYKDMLSQFDQLVHTDYYLNFVINHSLLQMQGHEESTRNNKDVLEEKLTICNRLLGTIKKLDPGLAKLNVYTAVIYYEMHSCILALVGGEVDDDYKILRKNPETVKLGRVYLQKCIDCFQYEFLDSPETKLRVLAKKKLEYLNMLLKHPA